MLRCSCSFITGSWVTKPGDRQAIPTSWIARPSRAVMGRAEVGWLDLSVFLDRSSLRGRGRVWVMLGEPGSFLTKILGGAPADREALEGDDLAPWPAAFGLLLVEDWVVACDVVRLREDRCAEGEVPTLAAEIEGAGSSGLENLS